MKQLTPLPAADHALTDAEIEALFGDLVREGLSAFRSDPAYIVDMMEQQAPTLRKREQTAERKRAPQPAPEPEAEPDPLAGRNTRIVKWRETGATVYEIATEFGISRTGVERVLKKEAPDLLGQRVKSAKYEQRRARIMQLRKQNLTLKQIAEIIGADTSTVSQILKEAGMGQTRGSHLPQEVREARDKAIQEATGTISDMAREFSLSRTQIRNIRALRAN